MPVAKGEAAILEELARGESQYPDLAPVFALHRELRLRALPAEPSQGTPTAACPGLLAMAWQSTERRAGATPSPDAGDDRPVADVLAVLGVDAEALAGAGRDVLAVLRRHLPDLPASDEGVEPAAWAAEAEAWLLSGLPPAGSGSQETSPERLAAAYALVPRLEHLAAACRGQVDIAEWSRPTCPLCGGVPDLALLEPEAGQRHLVCSRCNTEWPYRRLLCPFCQAEPTRGRYFPGFEAGDRLYICDSCTTYLKTLDLRQRPAPVVVAVERVRLVPLDLAAARLGYHPAGL